MDDLPTPITSNNLISFQSKCLFLEKGHNSEKDESKKGSLFSDSLLFCLLLFLHIFKLKIFFIKKLGGDGDILKKFNIILKNQF